MKDRNYDKVVIILIVLDIIAVSFLVWLDYL